MLLKATCSSLCALNLEDKGYNFKRRQLTQKSTSIETGSSACQQCEGSPQYACSARHTVCRKTTADCGQAGWQHVQKPTFSFARPNHQHGIPRAALNCHTYKHISAHPHSHSHTHAHNRYLWHTQTNKMGHESNLSLPTPMYSHTIDSQHIHNTYTTHPPILSKNTEHTDGQTQTHNYRQTNNWTRKVVWCGAVTCGVCVMVVRVHRHNYFCRLCAFCLNSHHSHIQTAARKSHCVNTI